MDAEREPDQPILRREVRTPERHPSGLGVMFLASTAMFFAVLGSAFIVRARMTGECPHHMRSAPPSFRAIETVPVTPAASAVLRGEGAACGGPTYVTHPDGTTAVEFRLCPGEAPTLPQE